MEFAAVNSPKSASKTVAITLTNDEARNPANAFSALLNIGGNVRFKAENGLTKAESQWLRAQTQRSTEPATKPKEELETKPKDIDSQIERTSSDDADDVSAAKNSDASEDHSSDDTTSVTTTNEAQPMEQTAAIGIEAMQAVAIQFQILVQLPNGNLQDMGTFDLNSLLAAASQDSALASALEAAFGQAADSLSAGQSLLGDLTQDLNLDPTQAASLQQASSAITNSAETGNISDLFKQIAAAFHPLAQQAAKTNASTQVTQAAKGTTEVNADTKKATLDLQSPEAARQSAALSKIFGEDSKIRIQVAVDGRKVADLPLDLSPFNRFVGYNPESMRTASTANGQAGQGQAGNAAAAAEGLQPKVAAMGPNASLPTNAGGPQATAAGLAKADASPMRAPDAPIPASSNSNTTQGQTTSFASVLGQTAGNTATAQTAATERPTPTQPQQIIDQIKVNITRAAKAGLDRVTIQLRPEELGRIEIKLELTSDGQVRANVTADNPATLELLQREARGLERALQDAGLNADAGDLEFNLRSQDNDRLAEQREQRGQPGQAREQATELPFADNENDEAFNYERAALMRGGIDTFA